MSNSTVPMIVMVASWRGGSAMEPQALTGITNTTADMLTEGAGDMDSQAFKGRMEDLNMSLGFSAGADNVSMSLTTLSENRDAAFEMARLALASPRFDAEPLARIKSQLMVGIRARETNPGYIASVALDNALYPGHPYARRIQRENVAAITRDALIARRREMFARDRMMVTVVGDIDAQTLGRLLDSTFASVPAHAPVVATPDASLHAATPMIVRPLPQPQSLIVFAAPGIHYDDPDWIPVAVANYILGGGGFSSRLTDQVRERRGLVYGISTTPYVRDHAALIYGSASSQNERVRETVDVTRAEIARLYNEGATQAEVDDAITYLTGSFPLDLDSDVKIASVLSGYQLAGRSIDYVNERNERIRRVTLADVNRVIRRLFDPAKFTFVVVGQPVGLESAAAPPQAAPPH